MAVEDQDWLSAHLCLDLLLTFSSASADTSAQALACPLIETLCRLLRRLLRHLRRCGTAAAEAGAAAAAEAAVAAADADSPSAAGAACAQTPLLAGGGSAAEVAVVTRTLPAVCTLVRASVAVSTTTKHCEGDTGEFPSATDAVLSECMEPQTPTDACTPQRTIREVPGSRVLTDAETPVVLETPVIQKQVNSQTNFTMHEASEISTPKLPEGSHDAEHALPGHMQALLQQQSVESMGSAACNSQKLHKESPFLLQLRVGEEPDLQLLQVFHCNYKVVLAEFFYLEVYLLCTLVLLQSFVPM